jgi:predicted ribonuclease YlaK
MVCRYGRSSVRDATAAKNRVTPIEADVDSLPPQPTGLIGRAEELDTAQGQVLTADVRVLTLIGPGGVGKTRLAVAVADSVRANPAFSDVRFVDLAPLPEPTLVPSAMSNQTA